MQRAVRIVVVVVAVSGGAACFDHAPASPRPRSLRLAVHANLASAQGMHLALGVSYRRSGSPVTLSVTPSTFDVSAGDTDVTADVDALPCLRDAAAGLTGGPEGEPGCFLDVDLTLTDDAGEVDRRVLQTNAAVTSGAVVNLPPVTLGVVVSVTLAPPADTLLPGDSADFVATARTATGRALPRTIAYSTSNPDVITVSSTGRVTAVGIGSALLRATADAVTGTAPVTVRPWNASEAAVLRADALTRLAQATSGYNGTTGVEGAFLLGGLLADEWRSGDTFPERTEIDRRSVSLTNPFVASAYRELLRARRAAMLSSAAHENLLPTSGTPADVRVALAESYVLRGATELFIAEHFCSGTAFTDIDPLTARVSFNGPESTGATFSRADASLTNAIVHAVAAGSAVGASTALSAARLARARARLASGNFPAALADAATIPFGFVIVAQHTTTDNQNGAWFGNHLRRGYSVADSQGTVGLNFASAGDPRLPVVAAGLSFDAVTPLFQQQVYTSATVPVRLGNGTEAAMIRAEARLAQGDQAGALTELNSARAQASLPALSGPATIDLIMRERAFALWGTGHRLGDLRRLLVRYGRAGGQAFPSGPYHKGGVFGSDVNLPISPPGDANPSFAGCLDRAP
jgi:hypothetical protein